MPTLAKHWGKTFNPYRLKARIHIGINAEGPIDRGVTPDYNDCFFDCAGQKPNYIDIFASQSSRTERKGPQHKIQETLLKLCDDLHDASFEGLELQIASKEDLGGTPPINCIMKDFRDWTRLLNAAARHTGEDENTKAFPSSNFCCDDNSDFVRFLKADMPLNKVNANNMQQVGSSNYEQFQDYVFFDRIKGKLVLRAIVIEVQLKASFQMVYTEGIELEERWNKFLSRFANEAATSQPGLAQLPKAIFVTDMFAFHWFRVQASLSNDVFSGIAVSLFLAFLVLVWSTRNLAVATISVMCIISIVASVLAFAVFMDWKTSVIEAIIYVMVIGLSVDYVIHLADAYLECPDEKSEDRVQFMVTKMGVSVLSGAISSLGAAFFMMLCKSLFMVKFGIVIMFTISTSVITSLVFFPALLLVIGPSGNQGKGKRVVKWIRGDSDGPTDAAPRRPSRYSVVQRHRASLASPTIGHGVEMAGYEHSHRDTRASYADSEYTDAGLGPVSDDFSFSSKSEAAVARTKTRASVRFSEAEIREFRRDSDADGLGPVSGNALSSRSSTAQEDSAASGAALTAEHVAALNITDTPPDEPSDCQGEKGKDEGDGKGKDEAAVPRTKARASVRFAEAEIRELRSDSGDDGTSSEEMDLTGARTGT
eukprot:TRINITY_DN26744_c0_g1_i1.p1 TRINITY_DN26744_c0_g1~~TRINITY_DN26744_c0_g1_i1.p1  ORF type:complete len:651 (+),score=92.90 TRINITY_DN26744_c0_g1_i1:1-1953(+)